MISPGRRSGATSAGARGGERSWKNKEKNRRNRKKKNLTLAVLLWLDFHDAPSIFKYKYSLTIPGHV
jgi:hypothetical protein